MDVGGFGFSKGGGGTSTSFVITTANGALYTMTSISELITIAAAATSVSVSNLIPANAMILGVVARVTVVIPTAVTWAMTITTDGTTLITGVAVAANTTDTMFANQQLSQFFNATARTVTITPSAQPADNSGRIRVSCFYATLTAPTS